MSRGSGQPTDVDASAQLRDPQQILSLSTDSLPWSPALVKAEVSGEFWDLLGELGVTLFVTREYEHLVVALSCGESGPMTSVLRLPHPSGLVADRSRHLLYVACTRNPNHVMELSPASGYLRRTDRQAPRGPLGMAPTQTRFLPGCLYLHDLALVGGRLMGNAVGLNAIVDVLNPSVEWWPASIETQDGPNFSRNLMQLNSIAAGTSLEDSFFTASTAGPTERLPGDAAWVVDRQGVVLSGRTREPIVGGLTRPHSARLDHDRSLWVDDSGYGTLNRVDGARSVPVVALDGWTRGLCLMPGTAAVGTSRVIPRFAQYAPGVDLGRSRCGVHLVNTKSGKIEGSLVWPHGDQIFAIDWLPSTVATGFLAGQPDQVVEPADDVWYQFAPHGSHLGPLAP